MQKSEFTLSLSKDVQVFMEKLEPKHFRQIGKKIFSLLNDPCPHDSADLIGYSPLKRVDVGEYRIVYQIKESTVEVWLVDKRNDDEVYKRLKRLF